MSVVRLPTTYPQRVLPIRRKRWTPTPVSLMPHAVTHSPAHHPACTEPTCRRSDGSFSSAGAGRDSNLATMVAMHKSCRGDPKHGDGAGAQVREWECPPGVCGLHTCVFGMPGSRRLAGFSYPKAHSVGDSKGTFAERLRGKGQRCAFRRDVPARCRVGAWRLP